MNELERLKQLSWNSNPTDWEKLESSTVKISSLNCRSLPKHFKDISTDNLLLNSDIITLQETWLQQKMCLDDLNLQDFKLYVVIAGKGKGIATYYKENIFAPLSDINEQNFQLSKFI